MLVAALQALYAYNTLATERILDTTSALSVEQWLAPQTAGRGSVRDTLVHLMSGQRGWLLAWGGTLPPELSGPGQLMPEPYPDLAAVRSLFNTVDGATRAFVDTLTEAGLNRVVTRPRSTGGEFQCLLWEMLLHVANHGTQHRSEVAAMLTAFRYSPGELDFVRLVPSLAAMEKPRTG